ncbi:MAG: hypothetical protein AAF772_04715 [Acidobacteriota bacterium]
MPCPPAFRFAVAALLAMAIAASSTASSGPTPMPLLLSEIVVIPYEAQYIEIHNPNASAVDLSNVYLTDANAPDQGVFYTNIVTGNLLTAGGSFSEDFHARFPDGATIPAGGFQVIALGDLAGFTAWFGQQPDYLLLGDGGVTGIPGMREALPGSIGADPGLFAPGETVVLYTWDGASDLVEDLDYAQFFSGFNPPTEPVDKTGVAIDGPDGDTQTSTYAPDTPVARQQPVSFGLHARGNAYSRLDFSEGLEIPIGGNGVDGSDETSENLFDTWIDWRSPSLGAAEPTGILLAIDDVTAPEGDVGQTVFRFTVSLSAPAPPGGITFDIAAAPITAFNVSDFDNNIRVGEFLPEGTTEYLFDVRVNGDADPEEDEVFRVTLHKVFGDGVGLIDGLGFGTILDDDAVFVEEVFANGFESGDLSAWSASVP